MAPLIANEQLKEIKLTQLELKVQQSLQLQEIKSSLQMQQSLQLQSSLQSLERTVKILSEKSEKRSTDPDVIDVDSLLSSFNSNPTPSESSGMSAFLPPAFGSPPAFSSLSFVPTSPSSNLHPTIHSLSGKQMRASSAPRTCRYFQQQIQICEV